MADLVRHAVGVDLVEVQLRMALGEDLPDELVLPRFKQPLAIRFLTAEPGPLPTGRVTRIGPLDKVLAFPGVVQAETYLQVGETIRPVRLDGDRRGYVIATADTNLEALERAEAAAGAARRGGRRERTRGTRARRRAATTRWPTRGRRGGADHGRSARRVAATSSLERLAEGARVVELGCGERHGRDARARRALSPDRRRPLGGAARRARRARPRREFVHGDLTDARVRRRARSTRCARSTSLNHVPRELLAGALRARPPLAAARRALPRDARRERLAGWTGEWLGAPMYFSGFDPATNRELLASTRASSAPRRGRHDPRAGGRRDVPLGARDSDDAAPSTLEHYRELLQAARAGGYRFAALRPSRRRRGDLILRHDVDLSLDARAARWPRSRRRRARGRRGS